jgi:hypothetical protein
MDNESKYKEREYDKKIDLLIQQVGVLQDAIVRIELKQQEISIKQIEITVPTLLKLESCLHGNGRPGLLKEHALCQDKLQRYDKMTDKIVAIIITLVLQFLFTGAGMAFIYFKK